VLTDGRPVVASPSPPRTRTRWGLAALLTGTAVLYLWDLSATGWANAFYSAAAQAGAQSWKAFLFGSSDPANSITVDKPPMSLWVMSLSVRMFGLSSWSLLVPQALMGVASVALLWDTVRRRFGETAGLAAGLFLALTPVAVVIFRYNNPDALLVLLMIGAVWAVLRAVDDGRTRWLVLCGVLVGCGYLTKQLQVLLVVPALAIPYLIAGPRTLGRRLSQLAVALTAAIGAAGWWVALVQLWPVADRPWIGGSQHNSILELTFGYNGLGRITGNEVGSTAVTALGREDIGTNGAPFMRAWGEPGVGRLFQPAQVGQIAWLLPAALIFAVALLIWCGRAPRRDAARASVLAWGLWLACTAAVFSFMAGIFHPYYTVALAPPIAALTAIGVTICWQRRTQLSAQSVLAAASTATVATGFFVLRHTPHYYPWLRWLLVAAVVVVMVWVLRLGARWTDRRATHSVVLAAAVVLALAGPVVYAATTVARSNSGALPSAGPPTHIFGTNLTAAFMHTSHQGGGASPLTGRGGCNVLDAGRPEPGVLTRLSEDANSYTWVAATIGSSCASGYQLESGHPVMSIGGFNGSDPSPPQDQFERLVVEKKIHYFIAAAAERHPDEAHLNNSGMIQQWVQRNFAPINIGGTTVYDLTR
jgi:4-amino-4-deoxy-L-arabinose transferase-like glycosyltransferase